MFGQIVLFSQIYIDKYNKAYVEVCNSGTYRNHSWKTNFSIRT